MKEINFQTRFWMKVSILTIALVILWSVILLPYLFFRTNFYYLANVLAGTSGVLLAMSFSLSSFGYYFDVLDNKIVYRKYLGLMGYFFALLYTGLTVLANPMIYIFSFPSNLFEPTIGFGFVAMVILTIMAMVSNNKAIKILGGKNWKTILGLGYIAYALLIIRAILLDQALWGQWFSDPGSIFTVRMFLTILGMFVLFFRASVPFHQKYVIIK